MKSKLIKLGLGGAIICTSLSAFSQQINPMMEAVFQNYAEALAENPKDYVTLFDRASQYYSMGEYARALSDIEMALDYTPAKESDYRTAEFSLKSDILAAQKDYKGALDAVNQALSISPQSQPDLYKLGNLYLVQNNPQDALKTFQKLQRESSRSQEAFYGMAKANAMMGNFDEADKLLKEVELIGGKQSFVTYCRIGDLYADMGNIREAATNYVIAYTLEDNNSRPIESLKFLSRKNPDAVITALDGIMATNNDNVALNYVKAILSYDAGDYAQAENACRELTTTLEEQSPSVYRMLAMSQMAQNKLSAAKESIAAAEKLAPNAAGVLLDKAEIIMSENPQESLRIAKSALAKDPDNESILMVGAKAAMLTGDYKDAQQYLNNVILGNPSNVEALLLRGYLNSEFLKDEKAATSDYTRAGNIQTGESNSDLILAALGKAKANKKLDADGMIKEAIAKADKNDLYLIAVYYAQTGDTQKAKEFADKALIGGYNNLYNLQTNNEPLLNLQKIRK